MKTKLQALKKERASLITEAHNMFQAAEDEERELTAEEQERDDAIQARLEVIDAEVLRQERQIEREKTIEPVEAVEPEERVLHAQPKATPTPFSSLGDFALAVRHAEVNQSVDSRLLDIQAASGLSETIASDGGFLVQQDFAATLFQKLHETGMLWNRCRDFPIGPNSNGVKIPTVQETSRVDGSRWGGVRGYWPAEGVAPTASDPKFGRLEMELNKCVGLAYATDELLSDAVALAAVLEQGFAEEFGFQLDDAVINGGGAGKPLGILNADCLVSVAIETGQDADTIVQANISKMWARMYARSRPNAVWLINQDVEPQLDALSVAVGTGGAPVYMPAGGLADTPYGRLKGRPVIVIEQAATVGDAGDIILADFSQYVKIDKGSVQSASSIHVKFAESETAFRFTIRVDGQPMWSSALTPYKGSNTLSPFVTLAERA
jgi:HK97 family phage major capsid protein